MSVNSDDRQIPSDLSTAKQSMPELDGCGHIRSYSLSEPNTVTQADHGSLTNDGVANDDSAVITEFKQPEIQSYYTVEGYPYSPWPFTGVAGQDGLDLDAQPAEPSGWQIAKAVIREIVETVVLTLIIFFLIQLVIRNFRVDGHSMDPNLQHGQYLVVDKITYSLPFNWREPQRGDVIVFEPPTHPDKDFVKRIIGLPGDTVDIRQGQIYINAEPLEEPFGAYTDRYTMGSQTIPEGTYFVMGDNRANSNDSRNWGPLDEEKIVGRAWVSYWPPSTWGAIPSDRPTHEATLINWIRSAIQ